MNNQNKQVTFDNFDSDEDRLMQLIKDKDPEPRNDWVSAGGIIYKYTGGSRKGLIIFDNWSSQASSYVNLEDCEKLYKSFDKKAKSGRQKNTTQKTDASVILKMKHIWASGNRSLITCKYLQSKGFNKQQLIQLSKTSKLRINSKGDLLVPHANPETGKLCGLQIISLNRKVFVKGSKAGLHILNQAPKLDKSVILVCEGIATGITLLLATNHPVIVSNGTALLKKAVIKAGSIQ